MGRLRPIDKKDSTHPCLEVCPGIISEDHESDNLIIEVANSSESDLIIEPGDSVAVVQFFSGIVCVAEVGDVSALFPLTLAVIMLPVVHLRILQASLPMFRRCLCAVNRINIGTGTLPSSGIVLASQGLSTGRSVQLMLRRWLRLTRVEQTHWPKVLGLCVRS